MLWYEDRQQGLGDAFFAAVAESIQDIGANSMRYSLYEAAALERPLRRALVKRFPYVVIFEPREDEVIVVAVVHARRRPAFWSDRA